MSQQDRTTLKAFFETGDVPTESQFADLIDSALSITDESDQIPPAPSSGDSLKIVRVNSAEDALELFNLLDLMYRQDEIDSFFDLYDSKRDAPTVPVASSSEIKTPPAGRKLFFDADNANAFSYKDSNGNTATI